MKIVGAAAMDILIKMIRKVRNVSTQGGAPVTFCPRFDKAEQLGCSSTNQGLLSKFQNDRPMSTDLEDTVSILSSLKAISILNKRYFPLHFFATMFIYCIRKHCCHTVRPRQYWQLLNSIWKEYKTA